MSPLAAGFIGALVGGFVGGVISAIFYFIYQNWSN